MPGSPAVLGNSPAFETFVPIVRPTLPAFEDGLRDELARILESGNLTKGEYLREFEVRIADYLGVKHAVGVSSGTLGLLLTYHGLALKEEVIVPSFTFMATVHPLVWLGARPVFVDIDRGTWNIDPARVEAAITPRTTAIVAVHNFGNPAPIAELESIASRHGLKLVFDAAHGFGALHERRPVGRFGIAEVFSLSPTKLLVAGEGGIVATNDDKLAEHIRVGREYGNPGDYGSDFPGVNARMPEFNAALGIRSLAMLEENAIGRNRLVAAYREALDTLPGITFQEIAPEDRCSYKDLSITIDEKSFGLGRDELARALQAENIDTRKYHDPPVHRHKTYVNQLGEQIDPLTVTNDIAGRSLSLPIWSHMRLDMVERISDAIHAIYVHNAEVKKVLAS
jgi:dTDP-4-amino-4,6-dideoxygalactose transaminase